MEEEKTLTTNVKRSPSCLGDCFCEHLKTAIFTSLGFEPFATCHRGSNTHHTKNICSNSLLFPQTWEFFSCNSFFWGGWVPGLYITTPKLQQKQSTKPIWQPTPETQTLNLQTLNPCRWQKSTTTTTKLYFFLYPTYVFWSFNL